MLMCIFTAKEADKPFPQPVPYESRVEEIQNTLEKDESEEVEERIREEFEYHMNPT